MYLFLCQSICSQLCSLLVKKIGCERLTLPVQQRLKMAWMASHHRSGFTPTQLGGRTSLKCQVWCVPTSPSRGFTGAVPAQMLSNVSPFQYKCTVKLLFLSQYWYSCCSDSFTLVREPFPHGVASCSCADLSSWGFADGKEGGKQYLVTLPRSLGHVR